MNWPGAPRSVRSRGCRLNLSASRWKTLVTPWCFVTVARSTGWRIGLGPKMERASERSKRGLPRTFTPETGIDRVQELARYAAVIHLRTPNAHHGYNHRNPMRTENPTEASAIDERIVAAWDGHPRRVFVESSPRFLTKLAQTIELIRAEIPICCQGIAQRTLPAKQAAGSAGDG